MCFVCYKTAISYVHVPELTEKLRCRFTSKLKSLLLVSVIIFLELFFYSQYNLKKHVHNKKNVYLVSKLLLELVK